LFGLAVGEQTRRRRDDRDAEPAEDLGQLAGFGVDAQARLGDAPTPAMDALAVGPY
jgi:hypothetical protein